MYLAPRIPELARRDRFIRRAVAERTVFAASDNGGLVRVRPAAPAHGEVLLLWSSRHEVERWVDVLAGAPGVAGLGLGDVFDRLLPWLAAQGIAIGVDWSSDTVEPLIAAGDLGDRLRVEMLDVFAHRVLQDGRMWILEGAEGPARLRGQAEGTVSLACWSAPDLAEAARTGGWEGMRVLEIPLASFRDMTVPWLESRGWTIAADPASHGAAAETTAGNLLQRLASQDGRGHGGGLAHGEPHGTKPQNF